MNLRLLLSSCLLGLSLSAAQAQIVAISLEQHNRQTGNSSTTVTEYAMYATVEEVGGVTGGSVSATSGVLTTPASLSDEGDGIYEYTATRPLVGDLTTAFPLNASYTLTTTGLVASATINGPGNTFGYYNPATTLFTISGVTGTWSGSTFYFNPASVTSFTVTINSYSAANPGGHYGAFFQVADITSGYSYLGEVGTGPDADATPFDTPVFTFTRGAALDGGDDDDTTYGFTTGTRLELEAGFFNVIGLTTSAIGDAQQAFIVGNTTSFTLAAIPEPSTYAAIFGALALAGVVIHRRRRTA